MRGQVFLSKWADRFESWGEPAGPPDYILVPIKIPKDSYRVSLRPRPAKPPPLSYPLPPPPPSHLSVLSGYTNTCILK